MKKVPFLTLEKAKEIIAQIPTPFHIYDEAGIRENARRLKAAFSWKRQGAEGSIFLESRLSGILCGKGNPESVHSADSP